MKCGIFEKAILNEYKLKLLTAINESGDLPEFPEDLIIQRLDNTWHDTAGEVVGNWVGLIYHVTNSDRHKPFMDGINPEDPLCLKSKS